MTKSAESKRTPLRYLWSHQSPIHRGVMRTANWVLSKVPPTVKYSLGGLLRRRSIPYSLVEGLSVVQIGAPFDTLAAGRSRAAHLGMGAGSSGRLLVVEPLPESCKEFERFAKQHLACETKVANFAVWSSPGEIELFVDDAHPATNFTGGTVEYEEGRKADYRAITVQSLTLDAIVAEVGFPQPDLVSITTNWAEREILEGMSEMIADGLRYICLALGEDNEDYKDLMTSLGYTAVGFDDRGVTYERQKS